MSHLIWFYFCLKFHKCDKFYFCTTYGNPQCVVQWRSKSPNCSTMASSHSRIRKHLGSTLPNFFSNIYTRAFTVALSVSLHTKRGRTYPLGDDITKNSSRYTTLIDKITTIALVQRHLFKYVANRQRQNRSLLTLCVLHTKIVNFLS